MENKDANAPWWQASGALMLAGAVTVWSLFWWAMLDQRVVDDAWWLRLPAWGIAMVLLGLAARRSPIRWYDPFETWRVDVTDPRRPPGPVDHVKRWLVVVALVIGGGAPWLQTSLTESTGVSFALRVLDDVRRYSPDEQGSATRFITVAREDGGAASITRVDTFGTTYVSVWDRPDLGSSDVNVPPPPNPGNAACVELHGTQVARVTTGACPR